MTIPPSCLPHRGAHRPPVRRRPRRPHGAAVAAWALTVAHVESEAGTKRSLTPVVLFLGPAALNKLLDATKPELAFFAAWAVAHRRGPRARDVVKRALDIPERLPPPLRAAQQRAILSVLSGHMAAALQEISMDASKFPLSPDRQAILDMLEARSRLLDAMDALEAAGMRRALLALLGARGLACTKAQRAAIEACADPVTLDGWVVKAATAASVAEVLASKAAPAPKRTRSPRKVARRPRG